MRPSTGGPSSLRDLDLPARSASPAPSNASSSAVLPPHLPPHLRPSVIVTRKDQAASLAAYEILLSASKAYTQALLTLSGASTHFAHALQECARLKGSHKVGSQLHAASGLEYLVASNTKLLADGFWKDFSIPLLEAFDDHRRLTAEREVNHARVMAEKSRYLKECEEKNLRGGGGKGRGKKGLDRDLGSFRRALEELQRLVDGLDEERAGHYVEVLAAEEEEWDRVASKVSHILRLQVDVHDRLSSKPLSDPILEPMLSSIPDPFNAYTPNGANGISSSSSSSHGADGGEIFSVLQHSSLLGSANLSSATNHTSSAAAAIDPYNHDGWGTGSETLTPAGLLSPRTPSTGLPRAGSSAWGSPQIHRGSKKQQHAGAKPTLKLGAHPDDVNGMTPSSSTTLPSGSGPPHVPSISTTSTQSTNLNSGGTGPNGEFSFAALGLTSATHPQTSGVGGGTSSIGSPLFGSEDGSDDVDDAGVLCDGVKGPLHRTEGEGDEDQEEEEGDSDLTAAAPPISSFNGKDPRQPTSPSSPTTTTATSNVITSASGNVLLASSSNASSLSHSGFNGSPTNTKARGRTGSGAGGLGRRLKKVLSIIDDEATTYEEKRKSLHENGVVAGLQVEEEGEEEQREHNDPETPSESIQREEEERTEADLSGSKHSHRNQEAVSD